MFIVSKWLFIFVRIRNGLLIAAKNNERDKNVTL